MCWFDERGYAALSSTPSMARVMAVDAVRQVLGATPAALTSLIDDTGLVTSELVTNAINAGATTISVLVAIHHDHLSIEVTDDAPGTPQPRTPSVEATGGRGLHIIERLAREWGTRPASAGKQVWARLSLDPSSTSALDCAL